MLQTHKDGEIHGSVEAIKNNINKKWRYIRDTGSLTDILDVQGQRHKVAFAGKRHPYASMSVWVHSLLLALNDCEEGDGLVVREVGRVHKPAERAQTDTQQQRQVLIPLHTT